MKTRFNKLMISLLLVMLWLFSGCTYMDDDDDDIGFVEDISLYEAGSAVTALGYSESMPISLYMKTGECGTGTSGQFEKLSNGDLVDAGIHTLGVKIAPRMVDGVQMGQRIFVSDGGWTYQVEAELDDDSGYYVCDFEFLDKDTYLIHPILIKVIYPLEGTALKEKFVVTTYQDLKPENGMLVEKGLCLALSANALDGIKDAMGPMLADMSGGIDIEITGLSPAVSTSADEKGVFNLDLLGLGFIPIGLDLGFSDTYVNTNDEEIRALTIGIEDLNGGAPSGLLEKFFSFGINFFLKSLGLGDVVVNLMNLDEIPVMPISFPLSTMLAGFGGSGEGEESDDPMAGLLENLNLGSTLFLNIYGMPELNEQNFAVIGGSLYATDANLVETDADGNALWPGVAVDETDPQMDINKIKTGNTDLGVALSQYLLNQLLSEMMRGFSMKMDGIGEFIPFVAPENPENSLDLYLTANPEGIAIDMKGITGEADNNTARLTIRDMRGEFLEAGTAKTMISLDLCLDLNIGIRKENEKVLLELSLVPVDDLSYIHVLKDDLSTDIYDHSTLISLIVGGIMGGESEAIVIPLPLSDMGLIPRADAEPGDVSYDGKGNCFMNLAVDSIDTSALGLCFINTAGL